MGYLNKTIQGYLDRKTGVTKTGIPREVSRAMRGWTKWGGARHGFETVTPEWYCQACTEKQTDQLPSYLIRLDTEQFARICSKCFHEAILRKINNIFDLISFLDRVTPEV